MQEDIIKTNNIKNKKERKKVYLSYNTRLILSVSLFAVLLVLLVFFLLKILINEERVISYKETGSIDYKVYLKDNDFYESDYLGKDMSYITSLIDYIDIDFNYDFNTNENDNVKFYYSILGKLTIYDETGRNVFYEKNYTFANNINADIVESKNYELDQNIKIDYGYYNEIANNFKMEYGINTISDLKIYLTITKKTEEELVTLGTSELYLNIPLSEQAITIKMNYNNLNKEQNVVIRYNEIIENTLYIALTAILAIASIVSLARVLKLLSLLYVKKSPYDKYINKILREYDRLIVETKHCPEFTDYNLIEVNNFNELLDVRDNLKVPIMYYIVSKHNKAYFYIMNDKNLYLSIIKPVDIEGKKNGKKK